MAWVRVNVNHMMRVRPTTLGLEHYAKRMRDLSSNLPTSPRLDQDGFYEAQMHDIMWTFGELMGGFGVPFETEVFVEVEEPEHFDFGVPIHWTKNDSVDPASTYPHQVSAGMTVGTHRFKRMVAWCEGHFGAGDPDRFISAPFSLRQEVPGAYRNSDDEPCVGTIAGFRSMQDMVLFVLAWSGEGMNE